MRQGAAGQAEKFGLIKGDGNNMAHSLLLAGASVGAKVSIATPERYALNPVIVTILSGDFKRSRNHAVVDVFHIFLFRKKL